MSDRQTRSGQAQAISLAAAMKAWRMLRWRTGAVCLYCHSVRLSKKSSARRPEIMNYRCASCRKSFTDFTGTPLTRSHLPLTIWLAAWDSWRKKPSATLIARWVGVNYKTAQRLRKAFLKEPAWAKSYLSGILDRQ